MKASFSINSVVWLLLVLGSCSLIGCGSGNQPTYPVTGQVVFPDGSTLRDGGEIVFILSDRHPRVRASGAIGKDGKFTLTTFEEGDGAIEGEYAVAVFPTIPNEDDDSLTTQEFLELSQPIDQRFQDPSNSGLSFKVAPDSAPHDFRVEITKPQPRRRRR